MTDTSNRRSSTARRALLGAGLAAGAAAAVEAVRPAAADAESTTINSGTTEIGLIINADGQGATFTQSAMAPADTNALSCICHGTGNNSALNVVSDNSAASAFMVTGAEAARGSIKVTHTGVSDASDSNASALSLNLATAGTAAQGIFVGSEAGTSGFLIQLQNGTDATGAGLRMLLVNSDGRMWLAGPDTSSAAAPLPAEPDGYLRFFAGPGQTPVRVPFYNE